MGMLTDPPSGSKRPTCLMVQHHLKLETLMYISGLIWFLLLPSDFVQSPSYFSENSLLPGLVKSGFVEDNVAKTMLASLQAEMSTHPDSLPYPWLLAQFRQLGLDAYTHNFTLNYPLSNNKFYGQNVYGILRASRGASTEAIVLSVPFRPSTSVHPTTAPGVALILALAKFCRRQKYWAKDLIFLVTEHEQLGAQAWLEAYHRASSGHQGVLNSGDMSGRGGAIQAAINLELHSDHISHVDVKVEGLNGQLPNLDLVNLVHVLCNKEGVHHTVHNRANFGVHLNKIDRWWHSFKTLLMMVSTQATGIPNGNHGLYHRFGIEAVTLEGFKKTGKGSPATFYQIGRVLEGVLRSLNNLLERFHQSYFFYLLSATDRYISIGVYMLAVGLMASTLLLRALAVWRNLQLPVSNSDKEKLMRAQEISNCVAPLSMTVLVVHVLGVFTMSVPQWFAYNIRASTTEAAVTLGFLAVAVVTLFIPFFTVRRADNIELLYVVGLIEMATILLAVSVHNFSLALFCSIFYVPFALFANAKRLRWLRALCWFLLHPLSLVATIVIVYTVIAFPEGPILTKAVPAVQQALTFGVIDFLIYGNWMLSVGSAFLFPTWLLFWIVINS